MKKVRQCQVCGNPVGPKKRYCPECKRAKEVEHYTNFWTRKKGYTKMCSTPGCPRAISDKHVYCKPCRAKTMKERIEQHAPSDIEKFKRNTPIVKPAEFFYDKVFYLVRDAETYAPLPDGMRFEGYEMNIMISGGCITPGTILKDKTCQLYAFEKEPQNDQSILQR